MEGDDVRSWDMYARHGRNGVRRRDLHKRSIGNRGWIISAWQVEECCGFCRHGCEHWLLCPGLASMWQRCCAVEAVRVAVVLAIVVPKDVVLGVLQRLPEPLLHQALLMARVIGF